MALSKDKKAAVVEEVSHLLGNSRLTVFAKYQGTSVKSLQKLRREAKDSGTTVKVVKNRLFKQAAGGDKRFKDIEFETLNGQLLYAFLSDDEVAPAQTLAAFAKEETQIEFVGGLMADGQLLAAEEVKTLASLPGKNQLIAETVAALLSPVEGVVSALSGDMHGLLEAVAAQSA